MGDVAMSWLETVFGLLCDDKSRMQLLCGGKRGWIVRSASKKMLELARAGPWFVYVQLKAPGDIPKGPAAALSVCRHIPTGDEHPWLYVLHGLKMLPTESDPQMRIRITGLDLSAMGPCHIIHKVEDVIVPLVKAHSKWLEVLNLNGIQMSNAIYHLMAVGRNPRVWLERLGNQEPGPLAECTSLTHLDLSGPYGLYSEGAAYLARVLPHMTSLRTLIMQTGRIGTFGMKKLAKALDECPSVSLLDVSGNGLTPEGREALEVAFRKRDASHQLIM